MIRTINKIGKISCRKFLISRLLLSTIKEKSITVFGGNGYVGQEIVRNALINGINVTSISRSGEPVGFKSPNDLKTPASVNWLKGDILNSSSWIKEIESCSGVISCIGAFGSNEVIYNN